MIINRVTKQILYSSGDCFYFRREQKVKDKLYIITFKTSVGLAIDDEITPERTPHRTFIMRVSSVSQTKILAADLQNLRCIRTG